MNTRTEVVLVDADAAIERLDAIAQTVEAFHRVASGYRDLEGQGVIRVYHPYGCLGPA